MKILLFSNDSNITIVFFFHSYFPIPAQVNECCNINNRSGNCSQHCELTNKRRSKFIGSACNSFMFELSYIRIHMINLNMFREIIADMLRKGHAKTRTKTN